MKDISILIPTYDCVCDKLVDTLVRQASALGMTYEVIVADDGSTDARTVEANRAINRHPCCRYIERKENVGRSAIRNFLAGEARLTWLLFIDSKMVVRRNDFLCQYATSEGGGVVYGGITIAPLLPGNLRSMYEKAAEHEHTAQKRQASPYQDFHTANFLIRRDIMLQCPFDNRFTHYGYEDVLLGKQLQQRSVDIQHIDNPVSFEVFEPNADFVAKTEEGLRTLFQFRHELRGYSRLLDAAEHLPRVAVWLIRAFHKLCGSWERRNLTGSHPMLPLFKLYKAGYFLLLYHRGQTA